MFGVHVEGNLSEDLTQNGSVQIAPLRHSKLKWMTALNIRKP